jgi:3-hydroxyisobutyrate dehydrogenase
MARVAFIGLGNMGGGMAANLAKAGHDVRAFDLSEYALVRAESAGCLRRANAIAAVDGAEAVVTMLPAGTHVEQTYEAIVAACAPGAVLMDCSTIDVATARRAADLARARGLHAVDAPVSGGIAAAAAGSLTFMVGGPEDAFARAEPFLAQMGKAVIHAGQSGAGQAAKICNNMILGATMVATCEAFVLADKLGLDAQAFFDIASVSSGQSWSMTSYCPVPGVGPETPADRDYQGGFAAALMLKDLRLSQQAADDAGRGDPHGRESGRALRSVGGGRAGWAGFLVDHSPAGAALTAPGRPIGFRRATIFNINLPRLCDSRGLRRAVPRAFGVNGLSMTERWTPARAHAWYATQPWFVGCNFTPSYAINQLEMWQPETFDLAAIERELALAASLGMNAARVYLHDLLWEQDAPGFLDRIDQFLSVAFRFNIRTMLVLFDSCWHPEPALGPQPQPKAGVHNSGWVQSPGVPALENPAEHPRLRTYVEGVVKRFAGDDRVFAWDIWNEPTTGRRSRCATRRR